MRTLLGTGILTWDKVERIEGRYGFVYLLTSGDSGSPNFDPADLVIPISLWSKQGQLVTEVIETRTSTHEGDIMRGYYPETPAIGEKIILGSGKLKEELNSRGTPSVGLKPENASNPETTTMTRFPIKNGPYYQDHKDTYKTPWLDPKALYRVHEQTVKLYFESED